MMVLVCAASKHGSTKEIAEAIGRGLTEARLTVEVNDVEEVSDLAQYHAIILPEFRSSRGFRAAWAREIPAQSDFDGV